MKSEIRELLQEAVGLLSTYNLALNTNGAQVIELLDAGVSHSRIAALYPFDPSEWMAGVESLTLGEAEMRTTINFDGSRETSMKRRTVRPAALTKNGWLICRTLTRSLAPDIPYLSEAHRAAYRRVGRVMSTGDDFRLHLNVIILLLHVLAASPTAAAELKDSRVRRYTKTTLITARDLTQDPKFAAFH